MTAGTIFFAEARSFDVSPGITPRVMLALLAQGSSVAPAAFALATIASTSSRSSDAS